MSSSDPQTPSGGGQPDSAAIKVIFIAGFGRSGSTLLDKLIGTSEQVVSLGEIIFFDVYRHERAHHKLAEHFMCTCGEKFSRCHFWRAVLARLPDREISIVHDSSHLMRLVWLLRFIAHQWLGKGKGAPRWALGDDLELFREVLAVSGPQTRYLCDSSKDFARLVRLLMTPGITVLPVHLVRDGRAVAHAKTKRETRELGLERCGYFEALITWIGVNLINRLIFLVKGVEPIRVSYDRFCRHPEQYIRYLNDSLSIEISESEYVKRLNETRFHLVNGNPGRFKPIDGIRYDDKWRSTLSRTRCILASAVVFPFNRLWVRTDSVSDQQGG